MTTKKDKPAFTPINLSILAEHPEVVQAKAENLLRETVVFRTNVLDNTIVEACGEKRKQFGTAFCDRDKESKQVLQLSLESLRVYSAEGPEFCNDEGISAGKATCLTTSPESTQNVFRRLPNGTEVPYSTRGGGLNLTHEVRIALLANPETCEDLAAQGVDIEVLKEELLEQRRQAQFRRSKRQVRRASGEARQARAAQRSPQGRRPSGIQHEGDEEPGQFDRQFDQNI